MHLPEALQDSSLLLFMEIIAAILVFFTVLIAFLRKKGHHAAPELMGRTVTFWWMWGLFVVALTTHRSVTFLLMALLCALSVHEYFSIRRGKPVVGTDRFAPWLGYFAIGFSAVLAYYSKTEAFLAFTPLLLVVILPIASVLRNRPENAWSSLAFSSFGILCFGYGLGHTMLLASLGPIPIIYCFFLTEIRDLISYWFGKGLAGAGRKLPENFLLKILNTRIAENVSPNKSWGVGILSSAALMLIAVSLTSLMPPFPQGTLSTTASAILGLLIGAFGLMGDLVFSLLKRDLGIKDSGSLLPGSTGVIDRIDSLVLTVPITFHFLYWFYVHPLYLN